MRACREVGIYRQEVIRAARGAGGWERTRARLRCLFLTSAVFFAAAGGASAQTEQPNPHNTFGEIGLLDMSSAHMAPDGTLAFSFGAIEKTNRVSLDFQALPWLEASFRYSHFEPGKYNYDRSFGAKVRLLNEHDDFADVSVGLRDLLGTGTYSSEYLAASKHVGPLDFTLGMGWGRLADTGELPNPLGKIFSSFNTRGTAIDTGGTLNANQFFRGPRVGLFGGTVWNTPIDGLSVIAEYSSDRYTRERGDNVKSFDVRSPVNLGVAYQYGANFAISAGWYYGSTYGLTLTLSGTPKAQTGSSDRIGPAVPELSTRTDPQKSAALQQLMNRRTGAATGWLAPPSPKEQEVTNLRQALFSETEGVRDVELQGATLLINASARRSTKEQCANYATISSAAGTRASTIAISDLDGGDGHVFMCPIAASTAIRPAATTARDFERKLRKAFTEQQLVLDAVATSPSELWLYYENGRYLHESEALGRIIRLLMREADPSIEIFHIYPIIVGTPAQEVTVTRSSMERSLSQQEAPSEMLGKGITLNTGPLNNPILASATPQNYPRFSWSVAPRIGEQLFDPDNPLQLMLLGEASGDVELAPGFSLGASVSTTLWSDLKFTRGAGSDLPHVRTDLLKYLDKGATGVSYLAANYTTRVAQDVFVAAKAGYLEDMFMGVGGEVLWRPEGSRFAIGADAYQLWQRNFDRLFGVQPYNVLTGHVSVYFDSPWYGLNFAVHTGRYLAKDLGATFEISRRFDSGVEVGAFATFTNVPFSKFGEGSFDKGIIIRIPLEWALPLFTQSTYDLDLRSLTRDGGQRVLGDDSLYESTRRTSYGDIVRNSGQLSQP